MHLFTAHKWGYIASRIFISHQAAQKTNLTLHFHGTLPTQMRSPSILVARNVFDALLSGYLYHAHGRECWVDENGRPNPSPRGGNDWGRRVFARTRLSQHVNLTLFDRTYDANPNLCEILASMHWTVGLSVYAEFAFNKFYAAAESMKPTVKPLVLCVEELTDFSTTTERIRAYQDGQRLRGRRLSTSHGTDDFLWSRSERERMIDGLVKFDTDKFGGRYARIQGRLGCPSHRFDRESHS